ncbi:hypothetical protein K1719_029771 [Acacia pycnantha]|nr:hypothetical protein K1719_029771 [Acacia pycnantha]
MTYYNSLAHRQSKWDELYGKLISKLNSFLFGTASLRVPLQGNFQLLALKHWDFIREILGPFSHRHGSINLFCITECCVLSVGDAEMCLTKSVR